MNTKSLDSVAARLDTVTAWLDVHPVAASVTGLVVLAFVAWLAFTITRRYLLRVAERIIRTTKSKWDDALLEAHVLRRAASLAPGVVLYYGVQFVPNIPTSVDILIQRVALISLVMSAVLTIVAIFTAINNVYSSFEVAKGRPIKGYIQVVQLFVYIFGAVLVVSIALDKSPAAFLTGIGAMTAILLLIFRDTILSLVASVQIASNDMVRIGDWIEMPKYGADGDVIDVALHTIKIQNWDKTITTIPTYKLIEDSFKNWRGMSEAGGRRIMRSIFIDMNSVRFLTDSEVDRFASYRLLAEYIGRKKTELHEYNRERKRLLEGNARQLTNVGTFRAYLIEYLRNHPEIHDETKMTLLVRQLQPGPEGLPIQIYCFANETRWVQFEAIQGDIFDHVLAVIPQFGLRVFQAPSGADIRNAIGEVERIGDATSAEAVRS
jgi:miniconductance mechanosensitive channel